MNGNLVRIEKELRRVAKHSKTIKYTRGLLFAFLMMGVTAFSAEVTLKDSDISKTKSSINTSVKSINDQFREARSINKKLLKNANLELVQLMEQGDQVVKSEWSSWQFGMNYFYNNWGGTYKGRGDKAEKYPYEGIFTRGQWWERNVSPNSTTYSRVASSNDPTSASTNTRKDLGLNYGLVGTKEIPDLGVTMIIEPRININIPSIPNLSINPNAVTPNVQFTIPDVSTVTFTPTILPAINPNVFNPTALNEVASGFAQDMQGSSFYMEPNVIINNASSNASVSGTTVSIVDNGFSVNNPFTYNGQKTNQGRSTTGEGTVAGTWTYDQSNPVPGTSNYTDARIGSNVTNSTGGYNQYAPSVSYRTGATSSPQTVFSFTQYQQSNLPVEQAPGEAITSTVGGNWTLLNNTVNPNERGKALRNAVRFMSVNGTHVSSFYDTMVVNFDGILNLHGRSLRDPISTGKPHMTIGVEMQAASAKDSVFNNNGTINLQRASAKPAINPNDDALGIYLIGMTAMIEDYAQYQPTSGNAVTNRYPDITYRPWGSEMRNNGTINVHSVDSIGIDFSEFNFDPNAALGSNTDKQAAWGNKGSLNNYVKVGNINVTSIDPANTLESRGSYGIRIPNIFNGGTQGKTVDTNAIYYDETIIDGNGGTVTLTGTHNTGVSISKIIGGSGFGNDTYTEYTMSPALGPNAGKSYTVGKGNMSVYNYQTGAGANGTGIGGKTSGTAILDNTGRTADDLIGNIYNLNILVDGTENVGFLRKADYMNGSYSAVALTKATGDFNIRDTHVNSIDFASTADGGVLFRTDKYGINLLRDLTVTPGNASAADGRYNIVMLSNGGYNPGITTKVQNTGDITVSAGGQNVIGLMAYNGGQAVVNGDLTITNSPSSIGLVISGSNSSGVSNATSSGNLTVTGTSSAGVYNNAGNYNMTGGSINAKGDGTIGVYAAANGSALANTTLGAGTVSAEGAGAVALYASGGSDITLNGTTLTIGNGGLLFYGQGTSTNDSQLRLTGNATANIGAGGTAFYVKSTGSSPMSAIRSADSTGTLTVNMSSGSTFLIAEGSGGNIGGELVSNLSSGSAGASGIVINGTAGDYTPYKASRVHLTVDINSNLDNGADAYLNSEFSSSSITVANGVIISGSGVLTTPTTLASKAKAAIAQKNTTATVGREDVILTNNGIINLTGTKMAGIVGEYAVIDNNSTVNTTGDDSTAIIVSNGGIATNNGAITVGNGGVGIAGINYLGVTDTPSTIQPTTGNGFIEIVHNGSITSNGSTSSAIGILGLDMETNNTGTIVNATRASSITLGNSSTIDVSSSSNGVGVYSKGVYRGGAATITDNGSNITIGAAGIGVYSEGAEINATGGTITSINNSTAQGIFTDSNVNSFKNITLLGDKSIGIHNYGVNSMYSTGYVTITNSGTITLGDSANINDPSIGIYTKYGDVNHYGTINGGLRTLSVLSETDRSVNIDNNGTITLDDEGIGVYKKQGVVTLGANSNITVGNSGIGVVGDDNVSIVNNSTNINIGDSSFGFAILGTGTNNYTSSTGSNINMGSGSVYLYKEGTGAANSYTNVNSLGSRNAAIYATGGALVDNYGNINYTTGVGNVGGYAGAGSTINNHGNITIAGSDVDNDLYSIGLATIGGTIRNNGTINVTGNYGLGMFAQGAGSYAENNGTINIGSVSGVSNGYGMYLDDHAVGVNNGLIKSVGTGDTAIGIAVLNQATLTNNGTIDINLANSSGVYVKNGIIKNYGTINIAGTGSVGVKSSSGIYEDASGNRSAVSASNLSGVNASGGAVDLTVESAFDPSATKGSTSILPDGSTGTVKAYINGEEVDIHDFTPGPTPQIQNYAFSNVGIYIDTLGRTKPINWVDGYNPMIDNDLIIGVEATELSNSKAIRVGSDIITPFLNSGQTISSLNVLSGSLTWVATPTLDPTSGYPNAVTMAKVPYTDFVSKEENAWNFADGLEQRYGVEGIDTREKQLFNKLNNIGQNEQVLLTQAYDEMMGHQYSNVQQRLFSTGNSLNKEFDYLSSEWTTASKQSNKIKIFGMKGEYNTDTAGIIDYTNNTYGVAYLHENETIKLGSNTGWYAGLVQNRFDFKDIGGSEENTTMGKLGIFKTMAFDNNGSLTWKISGEGMFGYSQMDRKFLVVDEIFGAESTYTSYGVALRNEISKDIRLTERTSLKPYGSLAIEYGRFSDIKEKTGEMRLEVEGNDYYSIKPEVGVEYKYKQPLFLRSNLTASLGIAYENDLGKVNDAENRARVGYTDADYFNLRGEKENRTGNGKADLKIGIENSRVGLTLDLGYDTKGENVRGGMGLRIIY